MAKYATKAKENIFTQARYNAAKFNDRLNSREGASEELGIDRSRLARIELGSKNPFPDEVLMMSDIYNAPELKAHFCKYMCPLGKDFPEVESEDLDRISVKALSSFRKISKAISMSHYIYNLCFKYVPNFGYAAALSFFILLLVAVLAFIQMRVGDKRD